MNNIYIYMNKHCGVLLRLSFSSIHVCHLVWSLVSLVVYYRSLLRLNSPVYQVEMLALLCFALVCIGDFKLSQLSCLSSSFGRASHAECGFESHLCAAFCLQNIVSSLILLCCFAFFPSFSLSEHLSIHVHVCIYKYKYFSNNVHVHVCVHDSESSCRERRHVNVELCTSIYKLYKDTHSLIRSPKQPTYTFGKLLYV